MMMQRFILVAVCVALTRASSRAHLKDGINKAALQTLTNHILHQPLSANDTKADICCLPDQWESKAFLSSGDVFIDAETFYAFINGTGRIAYDAKDKKSYVQFNLTELTPLMPEPTFSSMTVIKDYTKGVMYQIADDGSCSKQNTTTDLSFSCVPESAKKLSSGMLPGGVSIATYKFRYPEFPVLTSANVHVQDNVCLPLVVNYAVFIDNPDSGTLYSVDVLDLSTGIKDKSIFNVPASCNNL